MKNFILFLSSIILITTYSCYKPSNPNISSSPSGGTGGTGGGGSTANPNYFVRCDYNGIDTMININSGLIKIGSYNSWTKYTSTKWDSSWISLRFDGSSNARFNRSNFNSLVGKKYPMDFGGPTGLNDQWTIFKLFDGIAMNSDNSFPSNYFQIDSVQFVSEYSDAIGNKYSKFDAYGTFNCTIGILYSGGKKATLRNGTFKIPFQSESY